MNEVEVFDQIARNPFSSLIISLGGVYFIWGHMREIQKKADKANDKIIDFLKAENTVLRESLDGRIFEKLSKIENDLRG